MFCPECINRELKRNNVDWWQCRECGFAGPPESFEMRDILNKRSKYKEASRPFKKGVRVQLTAAARDYYRSYLNLDDGGASTGYIRRNDTDYGCDAYLIIFDGRLAFQLWLPLHAMELENDDQTLGQAVPNMQKEDGLGRQVPGLDTPGRCGKMRTWLQAIRRALVR